MSLILAHLSISRATTGKTYNHRPPVHPDPKFPRYHVIRFVLPLLLAFTMSTKSPVKKASRKGLSGPIKAENSDLTGASNVKKEEDGDPSLLSDPENYLEENESLDMNLTHGNRKVWLVKLPRYLAEKWTNRDNLNGEELGKVMIRENQSAATGKKKLEVKLVLNDAAQKMEDVPKEYNLSILSTQVKSTFVFSEENLDRFKQEFTEMGEMPNQPALADLHNDQEEEYRNDRYYRVHKNGPDDRKGVPFIKTIPKKTKLVGKIVHDCQVIPLKDDAKYSQVLVRRQNISMGKERPKVTFLSDIPGVVQSQAGPWLTGKSTSMFFKSSVAKNKADGRAIRMPKKDLLDLLFRLFEEYEYWSIKGLKEKTRQPETYLKESLESIAILIKKGPYTAKYMLKPEYRRLRDAERAARLGLDSKEADNEVKEEEDVEMEDVI